MPRKNRPYLFYDTTRALCTTCLLTIDAKIIIKDTKVYMDKWCPEHGMERVLLSDDEKYYRQCREIYIKPPEMPQQFNTPMEYGCPYDCGLCPDHMQHSCLSIVEITDNCNLRCPVCYAESGPEKILHKPLSQIIAMLDAIVANEGEADVVQLSGGEPTLHPDFWTILDETRARPIKHIMINTNGIRIANDPEFVKRLSTYGNGIEIYLQFDSFSAVALQDLRGADLTRIRQDAIQQLNLYNISTTLVVTVKRDINDHELGDIIQFGLAQACVRGVTIQPVQQAGRTEGYASGEHRLTLSEIRRKIVEQSALFSLEDLVPVPCNPDTLAMAYALKIDNQIQPLTRYLTPDVLLDGDKNTIVFERDMDIKNKLFQLFSTNHSPESQANCLSDLMCCLPKIEAPNLNYSNVFRVLIVQFMDAVNMDIRALKKSCIHIAQADGKLIPFESYNIFYRDPQRIELLAIQKRLKQSKTSELIYVSQ
jgi:7,8-dihydro-6-hydroxymethylpterin dimethyltransferase